MAEIDDLSVKFDADAKQADSALEKLVSQLESVCGVLGKITHSDSFAKMSSDAKAASESMKDITASTKRVSSEIGGQMKKAGNSIKELEKPVKETFKSIEDVMEKLGQKSIDLKPEIDVSNISKEQKKYTDQMRNAQNDINRILATSSADKQTKSLDRLVTKLNQAKNALAEIERLRGRTEAPTSEMPEVKFYNEDSRDPKAVFDEYKSELSNWKSYLENFNKGDYSAPTKNMVDAISRSLEELKSQFPEAKSVISEYENLLKSFSDVAVEGKAIKNVTPIKQIEEEVSGLNKAIDGIRPIEFTGNYFEMEKWVDDLNKSLISLLDKQEKLSDLGANMDTQRMQSINYDIEKIIKTLDKYEAKVEEARKSGQLDIKIPSIDESLTKSESAAKRSADAVFQAFKNKKIVVPTEGFKKAQEEIARIKKQYDELVKSIQIKSNNTEFYGASADFKKKQAELSALRQEYQSLINKQKEMSILRFDANGFTNGLKKLQGFVSKTSNTLGQVNKRINQFVKHLLSIVAPTQKARAALKGLDITNAGLAKSLLRTSKMLKLMIVRMALRGIIDGVKTGMQNLAIYSDETNASLSLLMNSLNQLKNAFAAAVAPILNAFAPALNQIIQLCIRAVNAINQVISALLGNGKWIRAKKLTDSYKDSIKGASGAAEELNKQLQGFDKLNNLTTSKSSGSGASTTSPADMFETADVEDKWKNLADKIKSIFDKIFDPLKEAWKRAGDFVMKSWKFALEEAWKLIKSIGKDFLEVWNQPETIKILENILHIIGDIGLVIGTLAQKFRIAWEYNNTGLHILENIRDIIGVVVQNIRHAADVTVEWAQKLNFIPILTKIEEWTASLVPVFDTLSGIITNFYEKVLLPLGKWALEKGLPDLLQVFIDFNNKVNWSFLEARFRIFWTYLERFGEKIGEGLIIFIDRVSDALADFINSDEFGQFLIKIEKWMESVTAEDIADTLENVAKGLIAFKSAVLAFKVLSPVISVITGVGTAISSLVKIISGAKMAKAIKNLSQLGGEASKGGFFSKIGTSLKTGFGTGSISTFLTSDIGALIGSKSAETIAATFGTAVVGSIAAWFAGNWTGKRLGALLFPDMKDEYLGFHWTGEGGFFNQLLGGVDFNKFDEIKSSFKELSGAWNEMKSDFKNNFIIASLSTLAESSADGVTKFVSNIQRIPQEWEKTKETFGEITNWFKEKWEEIKANVTEKVEDWKQKASDLWESIKTGAQDFVDSIKEKWESIKTSFSELKDNIVEKYDNFRENISTGLEKMKQAWESTWSGIGEAVGGTVKTIISAVSNAISWIKSLISNIKAIPTTVNIGVKAGANIGSSVLKNMGVKGYASGGFIEPATYFKAGEGGVPEILGTVGGRSAVAGGQEITGIADAVYSTGQTEAQLLSVAVQFLQVIANKDFSISSSDAFNAIRDEAHSYEKRTGDKAFT